MNFEGIGNNTATFADKVEHLSNKWDFFAITNMGSNNDTFAGAVSEYNPATPAATATPTDNVNFFAKNDLDIPVDGTILTATYNSQTVSYRHYVWNLDPRSVQHLAKVDVFVALLNTDATVAANQLIALRDVVKASVSANKRPALILGTLNLRYNL
ncbi:MAG: hypothetical protein HUJ91_07930, partial [Bacteroidales bacterium]|nr:hypothetical protein [Bacteroidales bacterium]